MWGQGVAGMLPPLTSCRRTGDGSNGSPASSQGQASRPDPISVTSFRARTVTFRAVRSRRCGMPWGAGTERAALGGGHTQRPAAAGQRWVVRGCGCHQ